MFAPNVLPPIPQALYQHATDQSGGDRNDEVLSREDVVKVPQQTFSVGKTGSSKVTRIMRLGGSSLRGNLERLLTRIRRPFPTRTVRLSAVTQMFNQVRTRRVGCFENKRSVPSFFILRWGVIETKESNSPRSVASCQANDWAWTGKGLVIWGLAAIALIVGDRLPSARPWPWFSAFVVAGVGCVANTARCERRHCYFTGPLFLVAAIHFALTGFHLVPMNEAVFVGMLAIAAALACLSELVFGRYVGRA
jgi:hypothetical protein